MVPPPHVEMTVNDRKAPHVQAWHRIIEMRKAIRGPLGTMAYGDIT
jgi:hypothetical protein